MKKENRNLEKLIGFKSCEIQKLIFDEIKPLRLARNDEIRRATKRWYWEVISQHQKQLKEWLGN